jgi:preprotein translocase subunit SecF
MSRLGDLGHRLYSGEVSYDFVGQRRRWYTISAAILLVAIASLLIRGLNPGIEFEGGSVFTVPTQAGTVEQARDVATANGAIEPIVTELTSTSGRQLRVQAQDLSSAANTRMIQALADEFDTSVDDVTSQIIGPSWGAEITKKALTGLVVFLVLIAIFLSLYFEWRMAVAALVALAHDLVITVGIYSLVGFTVTPATVIGILTILGYSLYDTVVVFDKVKENTRGLAAGSRMTYSQAANLAVNQTLVRSINTSIIALLPVGAILFVGPLLGAETLKDLSLALFIGLAAGTYSSIFIATPVAAQLKEREPAMQALAKRVAAREAAGKVAVPAGAAAAAAAAAPVGTAPAKPAGSGQPKPVGSSASGQRQQPRRGGSAGSRKRPPGKGRRR